MQRRVWVAVLVLIAGAGAVGLGLREQQPAPLRVATVLARRTTVVHHVRGSGHVEPASDVEVSAFLSGILRAVHVKEGADVKRGELLAELEPDQWAASVRQNEANVASQMASAELESRQLAKARADAQRLASLHRSGLAPDAELEDARAAASIGEARLDAARQRGAQAQAVLDEARSRLAETRLLAPIDGTVISLTKRRGELIRGWDARDTLLTLAPLDRMEAHVEVNERDVVAIEVGQTAELSIDALERTTVPGRVVEIARRAVVRDAGTERETTSFLVKVELAEVPPKLRPGMSAEVAIAGQTRRQVVAVPIEAVTSRLPSELVPLEPGRRVAAPSLLGLFRAPPEPRPAGPVLPERPVTVVFAVEGGRVHPRRIRTGLTGDEMVEVVEGLDDGAEVVVGPYGALARTLGAGDLVEVAAAPGGAPGPPPGPVTRR